MAVPFHSVNDTRMYLDHCICLWKDRPVYVEAYTGDLTGDTIIALDIISGAQSTIKVSSKDFDYRSVPLGYMNTQQFKYAVYVTRTPWRKTKQGVHYENISARSVCGRVFSAGEYMNSKMFGEMVLGIYPSESEATLDLLSGKMNSVAIHRHIAIGLNKTDKSKINLYYRNDLVASKHINDTHYLLTSSEGSSIMKKLLARNICLH